MLTIAFRNNIFGFEFPEIGILVGFQICVALSGDLVGIKRVKRVKKVNSRVEREISNSDLEFRE